jgi:dienelactone hydrolase
VKKLLTMVAITLLGSDIVQAEIETKVIEYSQNDTRLVGYLAYPKGIEGNRPGVLVVHEWKGLDGYAKSRTEQLAGLGYIAFAADIYGDGKVAADTQEAAALASRYKNDRNLLRARVKAGLDTLKAQSGVDADHVAAIGYCFGGTAVLELARSGADVEGVVSFHGGLDTPTPEDAKNIKAKVLALHGADDPNVPWDKVTAFTEEMRNAAVDWQLVVYGNAVHGFTNPAHGTDNSKGVAYNAAADRRSWADMQQFFNELFTE